MPISYGFLSTYPPTRCGLATFTSALMSSLTADGSGDRAGVVRVVDSPVISAAPEIVGHLQTRSRGSHHAAAEALNAFDVAVIQHDGNTFGGEDGDQLLAVLDELTVPVIVVAHEAPARPTPRQHDVLARVLAASAAIVAMSEAARVGLVGGYGANPAKVVVIPHGATAPSDDDLAPPGRRPLILTWGLLGPGKGIEWAIDGLQRLRRLHPLPVYVIAGHTHPRARQTQGEAYRLRLRERARAVGVSQFVRIGGSYLDDVSLSRLVGRADVVLVPYDSRDQVSSGVLVEAIAAGKPVVATAFPYALEVLGSGAGVVVPQCDGAAIGAALYRVLTEPDHAQRMAIEAARLAPDFLWPAVADRYRAVAAAVVGSRASVLR